MKGDSVDWSMDWGGRGLGEGEGWESGLGEGKRIDDGQERE